MGEGGSFGSRLRHLREAAGLTQEELAARAGLTGKAVSLLERGERRRPYPHTVSALAEALGLDPGQRAALLTAVRRPDADEGTSRAEPHPVPPTTLVGRDRELREVGALLARPDTRLVTLTGTGGVGKTRLALALLAEVGPAFPGGAAFVRLAPVASPDLVIPTVVRSLGITETGLEPREALRRHLGDRRTLLVLDNLEHLREAAGEVSGALGSIESVVFLVTSRAPLRLQGEIEYPVQPLWSPESGSPSIDAVLASPAGRLFVERARAASPDFEITCDNATVVAAICRQLAGLPLALEIVAAQSRLLGPAQLLARLDWAVQAEGARDLPERHRTLRRTLDWSHDLLDGPDRELFAQLSVFAGGFGLEAAEAVCQGAAPQGDPLAGLGRLVSQSLVVSEPDAGRVSRRYRLLEPVRQYAAQRLAEGGSEERTRRAHAEHFAALAEAAYPHLERGDQIGWLDLLTQENDNLRTAIAWATDAGDLEVAVRLGWSLRMYWLMRDRRREGLLLMQRVLDRARSGARSGDRSGDRAGDESATLRARLLHVLAFCHYGFGGPQRALSEECLQLFRETGDRTGEEYALGMLGFGLLVEGRDDEATATLRQALSLAEGRGDDSNAAHLLNHLAVVPLRGSDLEEAADLAGQALARTRRTGERLARQTALQILGLVGCARGDEAAAERFRESLEVAVELDDTVNVAFSLRGLALADGSGGASAYAARLLGAADEVLEAAGSPLFAWVGELEELAVAARRGAGDQAWQSAYEEGRAAGLAAALELARAGAPPLSAPGR